MILLIHFPLLFSGSDSKAVLKATMDIAQANYPEMLYKNHIVNAGWIFNTIVSVSSTSFVIFCSGISQKGCLMSGHKYFPFSSHKHRTAAKVNFISSPFLPTLQTEIPLDFIPESLGGNYRGWNTPFEFDQSEDGLLAYPHRYYPFTPSKISGDEEQSSSSIPSASPEDVKLQST